MLFRALAQLYSWSVSVRLVDALATHDYRAGRFLAWFWQTRSFDSPRRQKTTLSRALTALLFLGMAFQLMLGIGLLVDWARYGSEGYWQFGVALIISYPVVWAHLLAFGAALVRGLYYLAHPKKLGRAIVCSILERQVRQLRKQHSFTVVAVAGSVGKTSTKLAIADLLGQNRRVRHQTGNYNDRVTVPLVFFDQPEPALVNVLAWLRIFGANQAILAHPYPYDVVVVELGTDGPGQLKNFAYIAPDIAVITAVTPEHMEYFKTLDAVAAEELVVCSYSQRVLVNGDDIAGAYLVGRSFQEYSLTSRQASYFATTKTKNLAGQQLSITLPKGHVTADVSYLGRQGAKFALAAVAVADMLNVKTAAIASSLPKLSHFSGRMQLLPGRKNSILIDDSYNATPIAVCAALDVLYGTKVAQRIAILGSMGELGDYAQAAHQEVGAYCDPKKLSLVITIGDNAKKWLAPAAIKRGCTVKSFMSPYEAGDYAAKMLQSGAVVLAKGSQNGVFSEEALKPLLANPADAAKLVRQSPAWLKRKHRQFGSYATPAHTDASLL